MKPIPFGNYTLLERISHGGMAEVFRAKAFGEAGFERVVAIKLLLPSVASDEEFVTMLIDEAKIAGQLTHANIAQIFDLGVAEGRYYIVQEYVQGLDLRSILRNLYRQGQRMTVGQACHIVLKVCEGLDYAHQKRDRSGRPLNLVHRDISPQNILVSEEGEVKIIDFGIAKAEGRATQTLAGLVKGKFAYMSPEQIRGLPVDRRSDVFATGIVLHELLSNRPLFRRQSEFETLRRARNAEAEPPSELNPAVPAALDAIVLKALARHVDDRYQTAQELRDDLWQFVHDHGCFITRSELGDWVRGAPGAPAPAVVSTPNAASERTRPASNAPSSPTIGDDSLVEDTTSDNGPGEEATMVDPPLGYGVATLGSREAFDEPEGLQTPTDHDAQWAAAIGAPLAGDSPYSLPPRTPRRAKPTPRLDRDELDQHLAATHVPGGDDTTAERGSASSAYDAAVTDRFGKSDEAIEESTTATGPAETGEESTVNQRGALPRFSYGRARPSEPPQPSLRAGLGTVLGAGASPPARAVSPPSLIPREPADEARVEFLPPIAALTPHAPAGFALPEPQNGALPIPSLPTLGAAANASRGRNAYLLAAALFVLFLAGAATITLIIAG